MSAWLLCALLTNPSQATLLDEIEALDRLLVDSEARIAAIDAERDALTEALGEAETELAEARLATEAALAVYRTRLRALASMPAGARLLLLGQSRSLAEYLSSQRVLRWLTRHDLALHQRYVAESKRLSELTQEIETKRQAQESARTRADAERARLAEMRTERVGLLQRLLADATAARRIASERGRAKSAIVSMLRRTTPASGQREGFARQRGQLPWPTTGEVLVPFGQQVELAFGTVTTHHGVDIAAKAGAPVQAIATGEVVYADWLRAYGQVVILDHGEGYHSLSAHLGTLSVKAGQVVLAGTPIGTVGDTGSLLGTRLYFEIRHQGEPQDPLPWLRR